MTNYEFLLDCYKDYIGVLNQTKRTDYLISSLTETLDWSKFGMELIVKTLVENDEFIVKLDYIGSTE